MCECHEPIYPIYEKCLINIIVVLFFPHLVSHIVSHISYNIWKSFQVTRMYFGINSEVILQAYFLPFWRICGNPLQECIYIHSLPMRKPSFTSIFYMSRLSKNKLYGDLHWKLLGVNLAASVSLLHLATLPVPRTSRALNDTGAYHLSICKRAHTECISQNTLLKAVYFCSEILLINIAIFCFPHIFIFLCNSVYLSLFPYATSAKLVNQSW